MMNTEIFFIICIAMGAIGLVAHVASYFLEKKYKSKMNSMADLKKADK